MQSLLLNYEPPTSPKAFDELLLLWLLLLLLLWLLLLSFFLYYYCFHFDSLEVRRKEKIVTYGCPFLSPSFITLTFDTCCIFML